MFLKKIKANVVISVAAFFAIFFIFCGFAVDFALVLVSRLQLQNAVEISVISALDESDEEGIRRKAQKVFGYSCVGGLKHARISSILVNAENRAALMQAASPVQPFFLSALGIHEIEVQARAAARGVYETPDRDGTGGVPPNHKQYKTQKPFLAREESVYVQRGGSNSGREFRTFVGLADESEKASSLRWVEVTCARQKKDGGVWYSLNNNCISGEKIGAAKYVRLALDNDSPPNYYWDDFTINEISVLTSVKLISSAEFNLLR